MATREEVMKRAEAEADRILAEAREEARRMRLEAEDYVDAKLAQFEIALQRSGEELAATKAALGRTLEQVEGGRDRLRGTAPAQQEFGPEEDYELGEDLTLDPEQMVRDSVVLSMPFSPLCRPDCLGLCPRCGGDRNLGECTCSEEVVDPRWAGLEQLFRDP